MQEKVPRCRKRLSRAAAAVPSVTFISCLLDELVYRFRRCWFAGAEHPDTALLPDSSLASHRAKFDLVALRLDFKSVSRLDVQFLANGFGQDDAASFVNRKCGCHDGIVPYHLPFIMV